MDPVFTEVMKHRFAAIADEASNTVYRTAFTTFVKQTQDYQIALAAIEGEFFAFPVQSGMMSNLCHNIRPVIDMFGIENLKPGDVIFTNDPFTGNGLVTHMMDIHLIRPIFYKDKLVCFSWSFIHASDVGGSVPGSISPTNSEIFQEGLRIAPTFLYREGKLNKELWRIFEDNTRIPDLIWGDIEAMVAGHLQLEQRVTELCNRLGLEKLNQGINDVLKLSEIRAREIIGAMTDGVYEFHDYLESYFPNEVIFVNIKMTVKGDELEIDYEGSDPQLPLAMNLVAGDAKAHPFLCHPLVNYIITAADDIPRTGAMLRSVTIKAPKGTLCNAEFPAAGGNRMVSVSRFYDVLLGCMNQAVPGGLVSAGYGIAGIIVASSLDPKTGKRHVSTVEPFMGGGGGRCNGDGMDAVDVPRGALRSAPIETVEIEQPFVIRRFGVENDTQGAGKYRGGGAAVLTIENRGPSTMVTVRGLDRFEFQPWGFGGGKCGQSGSVILNPKTAAEKDIGKVTVLELVPGDILHMVTPTGGGFGDPLDRDVAMVLKDVQQEFVSAERARSDYGVIVEGGAVNLAATESLRLQMKKSLRDDTYAYGTKRVEIEKVWDSKARIALANAVSHVPATLRHKAKTDLAKKVEALGQPITAALVNSVAA